ncbi:MAG: DUF1467 family protein [Kiloniellales bacterium]
MNWFTGILLYTIVWWVVIFAVLPWGVRREENPQPGHADGAPKNPMLARKIAITSAISAVIWVAIYLVVLYDLFPISIRNP